MKTGAVAIAFVALLGLGMASSISKKLEGTGQDHVKEIAQFLMWGVYHECHIGFYMGAPMYLSQMMVDGMWMNFGMCVMGTIGAMGQAMEPCAHETDPAKCLENLIITAMREKGMKIDEADPETIEGKATLKSAYDELAQDCDGAADMPACLKREVGQLLTVLFKCVCPDCKDDKRSMYSRTVQTPTKEPKDEDKLCHYGTKPIGDVVDEVLGYNPAKRTETSKKSLAALLRELIDAQKK